MKKFIYWGVAVAVMILAYSCRETEEITTVPEVHYNTVAKIKKDSLAVKTEVPTVLNAANETAEQVTDPPKKDKIEW